MHIYRFFQPHHNPRLLTTAVRQLELSELEQAASELRKAVERAQQRAKRRPVPPIMPEHFTDLLKAMRFVEQSLETLCDAHPGDSPNILLEMIQERHELAGWETWTSLLEEQLVSAKAPSDGLSGDRRAAPAPSVNADLPDYTEGNLARVLKAK